ncbi:2-oxoglutarate-dependent dioxygenase DAO-like [Vigna unguiculata]|uniref:Isopenicillin N synthase-like n=1 Tax=Vigna unguiculata TaxID=3917 RepID=A0A4D6LYI3_VIGUN|nr:2-oxoglutarate-dependent dioxygenase DAO-like [Vigna unguiculata]QCD93036.1 Isopenicillin N synthase-like [Vigna unguiculata]
MEASVPAVDFQKLSEGDDFQKLSEGDEWKKLREACEKCGCFRVINHPIPETLMREMKSVVKLVHDLPLEIKMRNKSIIPDSGYVPPFPTSPLYEGMGIYDMHESPQALEDFFSQLDLPPYHRQIVKTYSQAIHDLASTISQKMAKCLGVVGVDFKDWPFILRSIKYSFAPENIGQMGAQLHSDTGFITLLQDDETVTGLELLDDSGLFKAVPPKSGSFLCIIGDVGHVWSNGKFWNVRHRVICKETGTRYSFGAFMLAPRDGNVEAPTKLVEVHNGRRYRPFKYEDLREYRISTGKRNGEVLDQYRIA